jgi:SAM-dependent methyltransferase
VSDLEHLSDAVDQKRAELRVAIEALIAFTGEPFTPWAPHLDDVQVANCRVLPSRYHILDMMPKQAVCIEVGTQTGNFALQIKERTQPKKFHIVDLYLDQFQYREQLQSDIESGKICLHQGYSSQILETFDDGYFDWIYIDADHSYKGFLADLKASARKLKPNGYIVCNDYTVWSPGEVFPYGILRGVHEHCVEDNWEFVFIGLHGQGYHDVCIRKRVGRTNPR